MIPLSAIEDGEEEDVDIGIEEVGDHYFELDFPKSDRPYQNEAVEEIWDAIDGGYRSPLLVLPTGSGKTRCASMTICEAVNNRGWRVAFVVDRILLLMQAKFAFEAMGIRCGLIIAGESTDMRAPVQLISKDTLAARYLDKTGSYLKQNAHLGKFDLIIFDECHRATNRSHGALRRIFPEAKVLGLTATPILPNGNMLGIPHFDKMVLGAMPSELLAGGYILPAICYAPDNPDLRGMENKGKNSDYNKAKLASLMRRDQMVGSTVKHWKELSNNSSTLVFCVNRDHARWNALHYRKNGISSDYVGCEVTKEERKEIFERFRSGETKCLHCSDLLTEGVDFPWVETIQVVKPTKSLRLFLQIVGRGMRPHVFPDGRKKGSFTLIDHAGVCLAHCLPGTDIDWSLGTMTPEKLLENQKAADTAMKPKRCPRCYAVHPSNRPSCPQCSFVYRETVGIEQIDTNPGKLVKVKDGEEIPHGASPEEVERFVRKRYRVEWIKALRVAASRGLTWGTANNIFKTATGHSSWETNMEPLAPYNDWTKKVPKDLKI